MISKQAVDSFLSRELDSFTWMKKLSRDQLLDGLSKFRIKPEFKTEPWLHQLVCFYIGLCLPEFIFNLDMGGGKTKIILDLMNHARREGKFRSGLVVVPRLVNLDSWNTAIDRHSNFEPVIVEGSIEDKWDCFHKKGDIYVVDNAGLMLSLSVKKKVNGKMKMIRDEKRVAELAKKFNFYNIDELHKSKNKDTLHYAIISKLTKNADFRYGTTGTLMGRNVEELWPQFNLIDHGATLGSTLGLFRAAFFKEVDDFWKGTSYKFDPSMTRPLYRTLQHRSIRYDEYEFSDLPPRQNIRIPLKLSTEQREHYMNAVAGLIAAKGSLRDIDNAFIRMRQITSGYLGWKDETLGKMVTSFPENPKLDEIERLVEDSYDSKVVISTEYTNTGRIIVDKLNSLKVKNLWLYGQSKEDPRVIVRKFIEDPTIKVLVMNSEAGGTGTDGLQEVARYLIFFESPSSPITRQQTLKRVHRSGQLHRTFIIDLVMEGTVDNRILGFIDEGKDLHDSIIKGKSWSEELFV